VTSTLPTFEQLAQQEPRLQELLRHAQALNRAARGRTDVCATNKWLALDEIKQCRLYRDADTWRAAPALDRRCT
jgi:hypothetical protein